jgi:hypothetical protein
MPATIPFRPAIAAALLAAGIAATAIAAESPPPGSGSAGQSLEALTEGPSYPLAVTGFGVGDYTYDGRTKENSFGAGKLAVALFREFSESIWMFGQLTTSISQGEGGGEAVTETEIDNLLFSFTPPGASSLSIAAGRFDDPLGFERDDEPLNLFATQGWNYELGRPGKLTGVQGRWDAGPGAELLAMVANGWDAPVDGNHGKTAGARLGIVPSENLSLGVGGLYGPEGDQGDTHDRYLLTLDYAFQPGRGWLLAGEANAGGDRGARPGGADARWAGAMLTLSRRFSEHWRGSLRAETFDDRDGARSGAPQTLQSYSIGPSYVLGAGQEGIFANIEHTTIRIPRVELRGEARLDRSNQATFQTSTGESDWTVQYALQLVTVF